MTGRSTNRRVSFRAAGLWLGIVIACAASVPVSVRADEPLVAPSRVQPDYSGRLRLVYDLRSEGDSRDSDFYGYGYGNVRNLADGRLDFYISFRLHRDLDHAAPDDGTYRSLDDADGVSENRLLQAVLDAHDRSGTLRLRLGRQYIDVADYLHVDGVQVMLFENGRLGGRIYYGRPVSFYSSVEGDQAYGLSVAGTPWAGNRTRLTYAEYYDDSEGQRDRSAFVDVRQHLTDAAWMRAQLSLLNETFRMARLDASWFLPGGDTDMHAGISRWGAYDARTRAYSPFYNQLGDEQPYTHAYAKVSHVIVPKWMIASGVSVKRADSGGPDYTNPSYCNTDVTLIYEPSKALSASLSLEYWDVTGGSSFLGLSGEVRYRHRRIWEVSVGSSYVDYSYQSPSDISYSVRGGQTFFEEEGTLAEESPYALTYYLRAKWNLTRRLVLRLQGDVEDDAGTSDLSYRVRGSVEVRY